MNWHTLDIAKVYSETRSSEKGLSASSVEEARSKFGSNELREKKKKPIWLIFLSQFKDFMILVLAAAALISGLIGDIVDTIIILVIVLLNAVIGFVQEYRAEKTMEALKKMATSKTNVVRDGGTHNIPSSELVPGDIVLLEAGQVTPADLRLVEVHSLRVEESSLTGESVAVDKVTNPVADDDAVIGDRVNMAYRGTTITNGRGKGIVVATGMDTEIGKIAAMLQEDGTRTPLQVRMADFSKKLSYLIFIICGILFGVGLLRGEAVMDMLLIAISLAVAAIPEALPALITIALANGAKTLVKKNVVVRKLYAVETLGSVTYICSDKTGTLTQNKMEVVDVKAQEVPEKLNEELTFLEVLMALNHDVVKNEQGNWVGDPTELAITDHIISKHSEEKFRDVTSQLERKEEFPFDSDRKRMTTVHKYENKFIAVSKGALEAILDVSEVQQEERRAAEGTAGKMAADGIRVIAYGYRILDTLPGDQEQDTVENKLVFAGLVGMVDPPRPEVKEAIEVCKAAGIHPVMITGDHIETATAIAKELGIFSDGHIAITGKELGKLQPHQLDEKVEQIRVYGRVSPEQKLNIVRALQGKQHFVAMTGDGANDAPSLKTANIGIAMGITGTDVSKEASAMILLDDNFATIVKAIKEGRRIYDNIRKFVKYIMACNSAEILIIFVAPLLGMPIPLLPIHILWINLVTDGLPGLALAKEKAEKDIMKRPPRPTNENIFADGIGYHIIWVGIFLAAITLGLQAYAIHTSDPHWQTEVFSVLLFSQLFHVYAIRSDREYIFRKGMFSNMPLVGAILLTIALQFGIIYLPFANEIFKTQPLTARELLICFGLSVLIFFAVELEKFIRKRIERRK
jgi:Ca2+-transporting ATPase